MDKKYDVVIIGAGIGGLVCGCYLVKAGLKVLVIEQHNKPGGCCTSFNRKGYSFDVGVHYLGGIKKGILGKILDELDVKRRMEFHQYDPVDKIIMPENVTYIRAELCDTIADFKKAFPEEKGNVENFFNFIVQKDFLHIYSKIKNLTFRALLDSFFKDYRLKATLGVLIGNIGASPKNASAFACVVLFRQYILDLGYYPKGGIQKFPDVLADAFKENGGDVFLSKKVNKILTRHKEVKEVITETGEKVQANVVISNSDAFETFKHLLDIKTRESKVVDTMIPTPSMFMTYLGVDGDLRKKLGGNYNVYYFSTYNTEEAYGKLKINDLKKSIDWIFCAFPSLHDPSIDPQSSTMIISTFAPYKPHNVWSKYKGTISEMLIKKASEIIPHLKDSVKINISATPATIYKYTLNRKGAVLGWAPILPQMKPHLLPQRSSIKNLYLVGHWCTVGSLPFGGIPNVAASGRRAARLILGDLNKKWEYKEFYL